MLKVRFIRHGESLANAGGITAEPHAIPLTHKGRLQAQAVSETFNYAPDLIIASSYLRARHTAEPTLARFPQVPFRIWPVHEIATLATARRINTCTQQRLPLILEYWSKGDPDFVDGEGAESYRAFMERIRQTLERLTELTAHKDITVFTHGLFMKGILKEIADPLHAISGKTMQAFQEFHLATQIENAEGYSISWDGRQWIKLRDGDGFDADSGTE